MQDVTSFLNDLAARVGTDTHLGAWLATPDAAPVVLGLAGFLFLLLLVALLRRLLRAPAPLPETAGETAAGAEDADTPARLHPEALSRLYDRVERREPAVVSAVVPAVATAASAPARTEPALGDPVVAPAAEPAAPAPVIAEAVRPHASAVPVVSESFKLLVPAVDRLLRRVESQQAQINALLEELKVQSSAVVIQGDRIIALEASLARVQQQAVAPLPLVAPVVMAEPAAAGVPVMTGATESSALDQAIALAESGADEAELSARFGLSVAEARLVRLVHGPSPEELPASGER